MTKLRVVLGGEVVTPPPVWLMRQAGRYLPEYREVRDRAGSFLDLCLSPELAAEVTLQPIRRFGFDAAILFADILLVPWALGQTLAFVEGEGPVLTPAIDGETAKQLRVDGAIGRLEPVFETVARVRGELDRSKSLIGFCGAPWTVATYMVEGGSSPDHIAARVWAYRDAEGFARLIEQIVDVSAEYLVRQVEAGADVVMVFDSWAGVLTETGFERWVIEPTRRLVEQVRARRPGVPIIGFPRSAGLGYRRYVEATGVDGVGLDPGVPLDFARDELQGRIAVQGNVDPAALLAGGAALAEAVERVLEVLGGGPLIFNLGHGVHKDTPPEHVGELVRLIRK